MNPDLRWAIIAAYERETTIDFIYDSQGPGINVGGEKRAVHYSDLKFFECRLKNYGYVGKPSRIYFEYGEIFFYFLTERGKLLAKFLKLRSVTSYYRESK